MNRLSARLSFLAFLDRLLQGSGLLLLIAMVMVIARLTFSSDWQISAWSSSANSPILSEEEVSSLLFTSRWSNVLLAFPSGESLSLDTSPRNLESTESPISLLLRLDALEM